MLIRGVNLWNSKLETECYLRYLHGREWYDWQERKASTNDTMWDHMKLWLACGPVAYTSEVTPGAKPTDVKKLRGEESHKSKVRMKLGKELSILGNMKTNSGRNIRIFSLNPYLPQLGVRIEHGMLSFHEDTIHDETERMVYMYEVEVVAAESELAGLSVHNCCLTYECFVQQTSETVLVVKDSRDLSSDVQSIHSITSETILELI
ncbi:hypothetical protein Tco_0530776 [Tanacetum coccineum]